MTQRGEMTVQSWGRGVNQLTQVKISIWRTRVGCGKDWKPLHQEQHVPSMCKDVQTCYLWLPPSVQQGYHWAVVQFLFLLLLEVHLLLIKAFWHPPISVQSLVLGHRNLGLSAGAQWMPESTCGKTTRLNGKCWIVSGVPTSSLTVMPHKVSWHLQLLWHKMELDFCP